MWNREHTWQVNIHVGDTVIMMGWEQGKMSTYLFHFSFRHGCVHLASFLKYIIPYFEIFFITHGFVENNSERKRVGVRGN
jgi:hypothetical protein